MTDSAGNEVFDLDRIRALMELMRDHDISEVELEQDDQRIRLARDEPNPVTYMAAPPQVSAAAPAPAVSTPSAGEKMSPVVDGPNIEYIISPGVGTFYSRPNPSADSFVKVGETVEPETTVCIIEAMKVFNEIQAEVRGKVVAILLDDEESVDHGKRLFKIDTSQ